MTPSASTENRPVSSTSATPTPRAPPTWTSTTAIPATGWWPPTGTPTAANPSASTDRRPPASTSGSPTHRAMPTPSSTGANRPGSRSPVPWTGSPPPHLSVRSTSSTMARTASLATFSGNKPVSTNSRTASTEATRVSASAWRRTRMRLSTSPVSSRRRERLGRSMLPIREGLLGLVDRAGVAVGQPFEQVELVVGAQCRQATGADLRVGHLGEVLAGRFGEPPQQIANGPGIPGTGFVAGRRPPRAGSG